MKCLRINNLNRLKTQLKKLFIIIKFQEGFEFFEARFNHFYVFKVSHLINCKQTCKSEQQNLSVKFFTNVSSFYFIAISFKTSTNLVKLQPRKKKSVLIKTNSFELSFFLRKLKVLFDLNYISKTFCFFFNI
jgi:hypothetical protein